MPKIEQWRSNDPLWQAFKAGWDAALATGDLNEAIAALDACLGCLALQGFPDEHPDIKRGYDIVLKHRQPTPVQEMETK